ncbi:MAG: hypothetical protein WBR17_43890 [Paraburkholderia sp.]|uniref:hypothetical protein n=1 Tax=Paraburkholderia sp. TaxID=1926495 RepID=UPI003C4AE0F9
MSNTLITYHEQFVEDFVSYMSDCGFTAKEARSHFNVINTLEACYRPEPGFWLQLDTAAVQEALDAYIRRIGEAVLPQGAEFTKEINQYLYMNRHDEQNAEMLAQVPRATRPDSAEAATRWICAELENRGLSDELEYAERDGDGCGEAALAHLAILEAAAEGRKSRRLGARLADHFRKVQVAIRAGHEAPVFGDCQ